MDRPGILEIMLRAARLSPSPFGPPPSGCCVDLSCPTVSMVGAYPGHCRASIYPLPSPARRRPNAVLLGGRCTPRPSDLIEWHGLLPPLSRTFLAVHPSSSPALTSRSPLLAAHLSHLSHRLSHRLLAFWALCGELWWWRCWAPSARLGGDEHTLARADLGLSTHREEVESE